MYVVYDVFCRLETVSSAAAALTDPAGGAEARVRPRSRGRHQGNQARNAAANHFHQSWHGTGFPLTL